MKVKSRISYLVILLILLIFSLCACGNPGKDQSGSQDPNHVCSFDVTEVVSEVGCDTDGVVIRSCSCGKKTTEVTTAGGHSFGEWSVLRESDCEKLGSKERTCSVCSAVETAAIERTEHEYVITEEYYDGTVYNRYSCEKCSESFLLDADLEFEEAEDSFITDCKNDFSFTVISSEGEDYIRQNLKIIDAYFENDVDAQGAAVDYLLTDLGGGHWLVTPKTEYTSGSTYHALRSGGVLFLEYGLCDLTFSITKTNSEKATLNDKIIFVSKLEEEKGGYLPHSLEYSEGSGDFLLTLMRADGIKPGDILCLGPATSAEELLDSEEDHILGKVITITGLDDGKTLLILEEPTIDEIFEELDLYSSYIKEFEEIAIADDIDQQIANALYSDPDFANLLSATYDAADEYAEARGLSTVGKTFKEFVKSIKIDKDTYEKPQIAYAQDSAFITAKIAIVGEASIPIKLDGQSLGSVGIKFRAYVNLNGLTLQINMEKGKFTWSGFDKGLEFKLGVLEDVTVGFTFDISSKIDYSAESRPYILNVESGCYHFKNCRHVGMIKDESKKLAISTSELFDLISSGKAANECQSCLPILAMKGEMYIINSNSKYYHTVKCPNAGLISESNRVFTERSSDQLLEDGYTACGTCHPEQISFNAFDEKLLEKIEYGDFGEHADEVAEITEALGSQGGKILLGQYAMTLTGIDSEVLSLYVYFDFHLQASLHYEFEVNHREYYGFRGTKDGVTTESHTFNSGVTKNSLTLMGKTRIDVGLESEISIYIKGMKRFLSGNLSGKIGLYAKINGALSLDFTDHANDFAGAYFEAGIHLEANGTLQLPTLEPINKTIFDIDAPIKKFGYERIYYNYASFPDDIIVEENYIDLDELGLLEVKYFDLISMKSGETSLSVVYPSMHYSVQLSMRSGSYCYVKSGYLFIKDNAPAFTDILCVKVIGLDTWSDFKKGNCKFTLIEYEIPVSYDGSLSGSDGSGFEGEDPTLSLRDYLEYEISEDRTYYVVSDVNDHTKGLDIVIPETHNGLPVKGIKAYAFDSVYEVKLTFPPTIEFVEEYAFRHCTATSVHISDMRAWCEIEFGGYTAVPIRRMDNNTPYLVLNGEPVTDLIVPEGTTKIGSYAFMYYDHLESVKLANTVKEICTGSFAYCSNLESVTLGASLERIGWSAFYGCEKLDGVTFPKRLKVIDGHAFDSTALSEIKLPQRLEYIGDAAFHSTRIREAIIPDTVTYFGSSVFYWCTELEKVYIGKGVKVIGSDAFCYCYNLREVDLCNVEIIGTYAFSSCINLTHMTLPETLTRIHNNAFGSMKLIEIENLSSVEIKPGYSEPGHISLHAFRVYGKGESSNIHTTPDGFVFYADSERCLLIDYVGGESEVTLPSSFGGRAYDIHDYAFAYSNITSITIPSCVKSIGYECFNRVTSLERVIFEDTEGWARSYNFDKGSIETIGSDIISDQTKVAKYLTGDATPYYWRKE